MLQYHLRFTLCSLDSFQFQLLDASQRLSLQLLKVGQDRALSSSERSCSGNGIDAIRLQHLSPRRVLRLVEKISDVLRLSGRHGSRSLASRNLLGRLTEN